MPIIKEEFSHVLSKGLKIDRANNIIPDIKNVLYGSAMNTTSMSDEYIPTGSLPVRHDQEVSLFLFNDIKIILEKTNLDVTFNEEDLSFNIFGVDFYTLAVHHYVPNVFSGKVYYNESSWPIGLIPTILKKYDYYKNTNILNTSMAYRKTGIQSVCIADSNYPAYNYQNNFTAQGYHVYVNKWPADNAYSNNDSVIVNRTESKTQYQLILHYNYNFIHLAYSNDRSGGATYPLVSIIKCKTIEGKEMLYTCLDPNVYMPRDDVQLRHGLHNISSVEKPWANFATEMIVNNPGTIGIFAPLPYSSAIENACLHNISKLMTISPVCLGGTVIFDDNIKETYYDKLAPGYYKIDEKLYFVPGGDMYEAYMSQNNTTGQQWCHKLLLEI